MIDRLNIDIRYFFSLIGLLFAFPFMEMQKTVPIHQMIIYWLSIVIQPMLHGAMQ